jgi:FHA domain
MTTDNKPSRVRSIARSAAAKLRRWLDPPLEADSRPLEVREAIVEQVAQLVEPAAAGRRVLTRHQLSVCVLARDKEARELLQLALTNLEPAIRARLTELRCPMPHGFTATVQYVRKPRADWEPGQRFSIDDAKSMGRLPQPGASVPAVRITVKRGKSTKASYRFAEPRILIGRTEAPIADTGRPRHNHVVFVDEGDEHNATVGRAHASIQFDAERRQFRLFDDGSSNGTRIVRNGETLEVKPRNPVGVALLSGDEIQFGTAAVAITIADV